MVEEERIRKRLALIRETAGLLSETIPVSEEDYARADRLTKDATERRLQVISEAEFDVVKTLYKDLGKRVVGDEESLLGAMEGPLGRKVVDAVRKRRRMRNSLVHVYLDVDQQEVYGEARGLKDLEEFETAVSGLLKSG